MATDEIGIDWTKIYICASQASSNSETVGKGGVSLDFFILPYLCM